MANLLVGSFRARLTALFLVVFGGALIIFSLIVFDLFKDNNKREFDTSLYNYAIDIAQTIDYGIFGSVSVEDQEDLLLEADKVFPFALGQARVQIRTPEGRTLFKSTSLGEKSLPYDKDDFQQLQKDRPVFKTLTPDMKEKDEYISGPQVYRMVMYHFHSESSPSLFLQVAVSTELLYRQKQGLIRLFSWIIPVMLFIVAFLGYRLSAFAIRPIELITQKAQAISPQNLHERVPVPSAYELKMLALTMNRLLDSIQQAFESHERFVADASHQLKTPLSILRGELDVLLSKERSGEEMSVFLSSASQEINQLTKIVEDLLVLARVDAGISALSLSTVRLDELVLETIERIEPYARTKTIKFRLNIKKEEQDEHSLEVKGDSGLLQSMISSILENAVKYSPDHGVITVELTEDLSFVKLSIQDQGTGITQGDEQKIFERYYRGSQTGKGLGVGLSIAKRVAELHGAQIWVENLPEKGANFIVQIKKKLI